jgi:hypothetical protein
MIRPTQLGLGSSGGWWRQFGVGHAACSIRVRARGGDRRAYRVTAPAFAVQGIQSQRRKAARMNTRRRLPSISIAISLGLLLAACGKPVDPQGKTDQSFGQAGMGIPEVGAAPTPAPAPTGRPLASDVSIEVVSWLVSFNRLQTPKGPRGRAQPQARAVQPRRRRRRRRPRLHRRGRARQPRWPRLRAAHPPPARTEHARAGRRHHDVRQGVGLRRALRRRHRRGSRRRRRRLPWWRRRRLRRRRLPWWPRRPRSRRRRSLRRAPVAAPAVAPSVQAVPAGSDVEAGIAARP